MLTIHPEAYAEAIPNSCLPSVVRNLDGEDIDTNMDAYANDDGLVPELTEDELMMASPLVYGFSLANKKWRKYSNMSLANSLTAFFIPK